MKVVTGDEDTFGQRLSHARLAKSNAGISVASILQIEHTVALYKARLTYNNNEMAASLEFAWSPAKSVQELQSTITQENLTGLDFWRFKMTEEDTHEIGQILEDNCQYLSKYDPFRNKIDLNRSYLSRASLMASQKSSRSTRFRSTRLLNRERNRKKKGRANTSKISHMNREVLVKETNFRSVQRESSSVMALSFYGCSLNDKKFNNLIGGIMSLKSVNYLELQHNSLGDESLNGLSRLFKRLDSLTDITLRKNQFTSRGLIRDNGRFGKALGDSRLQSIDLSGNLLNGEAVKVFCKSIEHSRTLEFLNLSENSIGSEGAEAVANLLTIIGLKYLVLNNCDIGDPGGTALVEALSSKNKIYLLYLSDNNLGNETARSFLTLIRTRARFPGGDVSIKTRETFSLNNSSHGVFRTGAFSMLHSSFTDLQNDTEGLKVLNLSNNKAINPKTIVEINRFVLRDARLVFKKGLKGWRDDAWSLATHNHGARAIAKAINELSASELEIFASRVVYSLHPKNKSTLLEVLIKSSEIYLGKETLGPLNPDERRNLLSQDGRSHPKIKMLDSRNNRSTSLTRRKFEMDGYLAAIKAIIKKGNFQLDRRDSQNLKFAETLKTHRDEDIRLWVRRYFAFRGEYEMDDAPPVHLSDHCVVRFATKVREELPVAIKLYHIRESYDNEILARDRLKDNTTENEFRCYILQHIDKGSTAHGFNTEDQLYRTIKRTGLMHSNKKKRKVNLPGDQRFYLVMPRMGRSLFDVVNTEKLAGYNMAKVRRIMRIAAECLNFVHSKQMIHGDFKSRNFLRDMDDRAAWKLIDFDATVQFGVVTSSKVSTAYCPPERVKYIFTEQENKCIADESFDIWSFGVVLFELLTGTPLFVCDRLNDNLFTIEAKIELMNWLELDDARLRRVMKNADVYNQKGIQLDYAVDLLRRCLKRNPKERISMKELLKHNFFKDSLKGKPVEHEPKRTHFFLSHVQVQAAGTVKDIFYTSKNWGCICWLDMAASDLTVKGMREGVMYSEAFVQILTQGIFNSAYCVLELLWAIDMNKETVFVIEEDIREGLYAFDMNSFNVSWEDDDFIQNLAESILKISHDLTFEGVLKLSAFESPGGDATSEETEVEGVSRLAQLIEILRNLRNFFQQNITDLKVIPYRRRNFETTAMMEEIMKKINFVTPSILPGSQERNLGPMHNLLERLRDRVQLVVFIGEASVEGDEFLAAMKKGLCDQMKLEEGQWKEISPVDIFTPEENDGFVALCAKKDALILNLLLLTPGIFLSQQGDNLAAWDIEWQDENIPLVALQDKWFSQSRENQNKERAKSKTKYNTIFRDTEVLSYRPIAPRVYEYEAMIAETSRRLVQCAQILDKR